VIIPNGVTLPEIPNTMQALKTFDLERKRYILLVGRFVPEKRHLDLIAAFNKIDLPGWKLVLVGDADHADEYSRSIKALAKQSSNIVVTGFQSGLPLSELYANAGVFVLPSSHEGLPIVMLEALSYDLPVLASDIQANLEVGLPGENYFPLGDIDCLAELLLRQANSMELDRKLSPKYHDILNRRYNWVDIANDTLAVYRQAFDN
jgi:glycosyltransferase involved in cell wall biosynthesis